MRQCRCSHTDEEHPPFHPAFETQHCTGACTRCECPYFHTSEYKTRISALRRAAQSQRGKPLEPRLFREDTDMDTPEDGDPADALAPKAKEATP